MRWALHYRFDWDPEKATQMKAEYDFSRGERGKFYNPDAVFSFPVYLEPDVDSFLSTLADEKDISVQELVNEWLRMNIQMVRSVQQQG